MKMNGSKYGIVSSGYRIGISQQADFKKVVLKKLWNLFEMIKIQNFKICSSLLIRFIKILKKWKQTNKIHF